jgi:hypothetical protein
MFNSIYNLINNQPFNNLLEKGWTKNYNRWGIWLDQKLPAIYHAYA